MEVLNLRKLQKKKTLPQAFYARLLAGVLLQNHQPIVLRFHANYVKLLGAEESFQ
jgi:hypothetical protein